MDGEIKTRPRPWDLARYGLLAIVCFGEALAVEINQGSDTSVDPETGLVSWQARLPSFSLTLVQRIPDQTRAFFLGRGFSRKAVERLATRCVFQSTARNVASDSALKFDLSEWRTIAEGAERPLLLDGDWQKTWSALGETNAARIAFRWSLLPTQQTYSGGDWNMGMLILDADQGQQVDLRMGWSVGEIKYHHTLKGIVCAGEQKEG